MLKFMSMGIAAAIAASAFTPVAAEARPYGYNDGGYYQQAGWRDRRDRRDDRRYYRQGYRDGRGSSYRGGRRSYRCDKGNGGTVIGAIAGGLLGNEVAGRGDRTMGTVIGAGVGAVAGRAIDRDC